MTLPTTSATTGDRTTLIALDWGTSSLRAYRFGAHGKLLDKRALPWGIMNLPPLPDGSNETGQGFRLALLAACGDWLQAAPGTALIAAGMIGSKQGWREAPYLDTPQALNAIGNTLTLVDAAETGLGVPLHIVPGLLQQGALPNVMRGEETQVAGILDQLQVDDLLVGLPGTHSKWVHVHNRSITHFNTLRTGEFNPHCASTPFSAAPCNRMATPMMRPSCAARPWPTAPTAAPACCQTSSAAARWA